MEAGEVQWELFTTKGLYSRGVHGSAKVAGPSLAFGHHSRRSPDEVRQENGMVRHGS